MPHALVAETAGLARAALRGKPQQASNLSIAGR